VSADIVMKIVHRQADYSNIPYTKRRLFHYRLSGISTAPKRIRLRRDVRPANA